MRGRGRDARLVRVERQLQQLLKDPDARLIAPGSPIDQLVDIVPVRVTEAIDEENGEYLAVRQIPTSHGVMSDDPDDSTPLTIRTIKNVEGDAATLSVGDKVYVKLDGVSSGGTPYYHVVMSSASAWWGLITACYPETGYGQAVPMEATFTQDGDPAFTGGGAAIPVILGKYPPYRTNTEHKFGVFVHVKDSDPPWVLMQHIRVAYTDEGDGTERGSCSE